jgi:hypothetical protein
MGPLPRDGPVVRGPQDTAARRSPDNPPMSNAVNTEFAALKLAQQVYAQARAAAAQ